MESLGSRPNARRTFNHKDTAAVIELGLYGAEDIAVCIVRGNEHETVIGRRMGQERPQEVN